MNEVKFQARMKQ